MTFKFHYNKTTIQQFRRQLAIREKALPILKNKETALRKEEKEMRKELDRLFDEKRDVEQKQKAFDAFWNEFPNILSLEDPGVFYKKIVGVRVPEINEVSFRLADVSWWNYPAWVPAGIEVIQHVISLDIKIKIKNLQVEALNAARKKTTQKVNLYEKVQIPAYEEAILKIKRFLEDKENISKAAQKIVKKRKERGLIA
jgi:V/A-type H+-transporting ATPase subunit D